MGYEVMSEFGKCVCVWSVLLELRRKVLGRSHHSGSNESLQVPKRDRIVRTGTGFVDNLLPFIIYLYILFIQPHQKKPVDGILIHLALASVITAVFRGIPYIVTSFRIRNILEDIGCKAVLYIFRVTWGAYICTSSLLSTSQAIIISPAHSKWAWLKPRIFTLILPLLIYSWISSVLMNTCVIISTPATNSPTEVGLVYCLMFCKTRRFTYHYQCYFKVSCLCWISSFFLHDLDQFPHGDCPIQASQDTHAYPQSQPLSTIFSRDKSHPYYPLASELLCFLLWDYLGSFHSCELCT